MHRKHEKVLNNKNYQRDNHEEACAALEIEDPAVPFMPGMDKLGDPLFSWQPVGINAIREFEEQALSGCILADEVGIGKTRQVGGYLLYRMNKRAELLEAAKLDPSIIVPKAKPVLIVCPTNLLTQWKTELSILALCKFTFKSYWGETREHAHQRNLPLLKKNNKIFNGDEDTFNIVVLSTFKTMAIRHGPGKRRREFMKTLARDIQEARRRRGEANTRALVQDIKWEYDLKDCFDVGVFDESHAMKNPKTDTSVTIQWLNLKFHVLVTATPCSNRIGDFLGFLQFIEPKIDWEAHEFEWGWDVGRMKWQNPYLLDPTEPGAIMMLRPEQFKKYVLTQRKDVDDIDRGKALANAYSLCMIRRTYGSEVNGKLIIDQLPGLFMQQVRVNFTEEELEEYRTFTEEALQCLLSKDPKTGKPIWNMKHYRTLVSTASWLALGDPLLIDVLDSTSNVRWLRTKNLLYTWLRKIDRETVDDPHDWKKIVDMGVSGSPKMRSLLAIFGDTVVLHGTKAIIYCNIPRTQMYIHEVLTQIGIDAHLYTSDLSQSQRDKLVRRFNEKHVYGDPQSCQVLICSYQVNCCGLNLQKSCHQVHLWDPPPSEPLGKQAIGRIYRIGQLEIVKVWTYFVMNSFNGKQIQRNMQKMLPLLIADMDPDQLEGGEVNLPLEPWVWHEKKLVHARVLRNQGIEVDPKHYLDVEVVLENLISAWKGEFVDVILPDDGRGFTDDGLGGDEVRDPAAYDADFERENGEEGAEAHTPSPRGKGTPRRDAPKKKGKEKAPHGFDQTKAEVEAEETRWQGDDLE